MAYIVAVEICNDRLLAAVARRSAGRSQVIETLSIDIAGQSEAHWGETLKAALGSKANRNTEMIAVISRAHAEVREITVPPAPDDELPEMIKFKARAEFGSFNENWSLDFVPLSDDPETERTVFAAAISPETRQQYSRLATTAGLKLKHLLFRPYAKLELLASQIADSEYRLIVDSDYDTTDITVACGRQLHTTRTVKTGPATDEEYRVAQLEREIRLTIASSGRRLGNESFKEILIVDDDEDNVALSGRLEKQTGITTRCIEPFAMAGVGSGFKKPADSHLFAALLGALKKTTDQHIAQIDFLHPRKRREKKLDLKRFYWVGGVAAAALFLVMLGGWFFLHSQKSEIADLRAAYDQQIDENDKHDGKPSVDQVLGEIKEIDDFVRGRINWLDQFYVISKNSGTADDAIVRTWKYVPMNSNVQSRIEITGFESGKPNRLNSLLFAKGIGTENRRSSDITGTEESGHDRTYRVEFEPQFVDGGDIIKQYTQLAVALQQQQAQAAAENADKSD